MKTLTSIIFIIGFVLATGCTDKKAETEKARTEAEAKARAEAAKKEMETLPKTFQTPDYFEKNEPPKKPEPKKDGATKTAP
jgi:hypothetical protein